MSTTQVSEIRSGHTIIVHTDDRPSTTMQVQVHRVTTETYPFAEWVEIIDADGNHWQFHKTDLVEVKD